MAQNRYYSSIAVKTTLVSTLSSGATTFSVVSAGGFPVSVPFTLILERDTALEEIVTVNTISGTNITSCTRGVDGTSAVGHNAGAAVEHGVSARDFTEPQVHIGAASAAHGVTGSVVGTSDTQTLTNKAISGASNTLTAIPKSAVTGAPAGAYVGDTDAQTLTNKTMSGAANTFSLIPQSASHASPDTDAGTSSLHHTLGTGANQAAPGTPTAASKYPLGRVGSSALQANGNDNGTNADQILRGLDQATLLDGRRYRVTMTFAGNVTTAAGRVTATVRLGGSSAAEGGHIVPTGTLVASGLNYLDTTSKTYTWTFADEIICASAGGTITPGTYYIYICAANPDQGTSFATYLGSASIGSRCRVLIEDIGPQ